MSLYEDAYSIELLSNPFFVPLKIWKTFTP